MPCEISIDDDLLNAALAVSVRKSPTDTVHEALREYIQRRRQAKIIELYGTIDYEESFDYKRQRNRN